MRIAIATMTVDEVLVFVAFIGFDWHVDVTMLTTGEVAEVLGVSRQHVANLADRGELLSVMVGKHRRIPKSETDRLLRSTRLTPGQVKSLRLHQALIGELLADPTGVIGAARANIHRWMPGQRSDGITASYMRKWEVTLDAGVSRIIEVLNAVDEQACEMRANSPFAGVLSQDRRSKILATISKCQEATVL